MENQLHVFLKSLQATYHVLYADLQHYHWQVKGPFFFQLHEKFQSYYEQVATFVDDTAERNLIIQGVPLLSIRDYFKHSFIPEETATDLDYISMVFHLKQNFVLISEKLKEGILLAQELNDEVTQDLFIGMKSYFEKEIWMLNSFLAH